MRRICKYCGQEYDGDPGSSCCPDCAAAQRVTTLRTRTCRTCGKSFQGGPRAWYCPECRVERKRETDRRFRRTGPARPLGSTDLCEVCGKPYVVESGRQKYCKGCAEAAVREVDRLQSLAWNRANTTPVQRREERRTSTATIPCVVCGKGFVPRGVSKTCSPACAAQLARRKAADREEKNRDARNARRRELREQKLSKMSEEELAAYRQEINREARENYRKRKEKD